MPDTLKLLGLIKPFWRSYMLAILALTVGTICFLFVPPQIGKLIGGISKLSDGAFDESMWVIIITLAGLLIIQAICSAFHAFLISNTSEQIINNLRISFFSSLIAQPLSTSDKQPSGEIASEFASDLVIIQGGIADNLINLLRNGLFSVAAFIALLFISAKITLVTLSGVLFIVLVVICFVRLANKSILAVQKYRAKTVSLLLEASNNSYIIQAYHRVGYMNERFRCVVSESFTKVKYHLLLMACISPISLIVFALVIALSLAYGAKQVSLAFITLEEFVTYISYAVIMVASVSQVGLLFGRLKQASTLYIKHEKKFADLKLFNTPDYTSTRQSEVGYSLSDSGASSHSTELLGITLNKVSFTYFNQSKPAVQGISFRVLPGQITAVVGKSGAGKSTIAGLLTGLFQPSSGEISFTSNTSGYCPIFPPTQNQVAIVPQEPFLMSGSFLENITFGREDISYEEARLAARLARIDEFIETQPDQYNTRIDECGNNLSRGQKQRIALARALVLKPNILLLDEATASVDVVTELAIKNMVEELRNEMTVIVIAHQGQLLSVVDQVVVIDEGQVVFDGTAADFRLKIHEDTFSQIFKQAANF